MSHKQLHAYLCTQQLALAMSRMHQGNAFSIFLAPAKLLTLQGALHSAAEDVVL